MTVENIISRVAECIPLRIKVALRGDRASPSRLANVIHSLLNRLAVERYPILPCGGVLKGFRMRVDWQLHRSFAYGSWEPEVVRSIQKHVIPGTTVLDIGAQSGFYSLLLSRLVGLEGMVVAFEPLPANFRVLEENLNLNKVQNVTIRREAVSDRSGEISFAFPHEEASLVAGPVLESDNLGTFQVPSISLDDFMLQSGRSVQFVKMDVEGAETAVLRGAVQTLRTYHPSLVVELHHDPPQDGLHPAVPLLKELGYQIEWLNEVGYRSHIFAHWIPSNTGSGDVA
ncbi:MAG TPA: FkbM family methyltransferase [Candidatus Acidoferrum sp.]|jgi:FkbM family methyltransferase|nr:FkbM family methyltransferase [Candidatus Acidoferrum sp.]